VKRRDVELAWAAWLIVGGVSFAILETIALGTHRLPTLSRTLRRWMGVQPRCRYGGVSPLGFVAAGAWLAWHIAQVEREIVEGSCGEL
jgi:hypothetical protein